MQSLGRSRQWASYFMLGETRDRGVLDEFANIISDVYVDNSFDHTTTNYF